VGCGNRVHGARKRLLENSLSGFPVEREKLERALNTVQELDSSEPSRRSIVRRKDYPRATLHDLVPRSTCRPTLEAVMSIEDTVGIPRRPEPGRQRRKYETNSFKHQVFSKLPFQNLHPTSTTSDSAKQEQSCFAGAPSRMT